MKNCNRTTCKQQNPQELNQFSRDKCKKDGLTSMCKSCYKEYHLENKEHLTEMSRRRKLKIKYNLSLEEYNQMLEKQNYSCEICGKIQEYLRTKHKENKGFFCVDHCHKTGKVRGLLCGECNRGIGMFKDDIELLNKAIEYLKK